MSTSTLREQFQSIIDEYQRGLRPGIEDALTESASLMKEKLVAASPYDAESDSLPHYRDCWQQENKYRGVRYVGNTKTVHDNIPLSNLIEYGTKGHPFIARTFDANSDEIFRRFVHKMEEKIT